MRWISEQRQKPLYCSLYSRISLESDYPVKAAEDDDDGKETEGEFYGIVVQNSEIDAEKFYKTAEKQKKELENRIKTLDNIIRCYMKIG